MTLQAQGEIRLSQIAGEFSLPAPYVFPRDFYGKGGAAGAGELRFSNFYGRSAALPPAVAMNDATYSGGDTSARVALKADGTWILTGDGVDLPTYPHAWLTQGQAADVEVMVTRTGSTGVGSTLNAWLPMTADYSWQLNAPTTAKSCTLNFTFRNKNTQAQLDTATVNLSLVGGGSIGGGGGRL